MGEFDFIRWLRRQTLSDPRTLVGPGDDCAVLADAGGNPFLVTTDMLMEGVDFIFQEAGPRRIGRKAMAVNLSDIAAMGGRPRAAVVSLALPRRLAQADAEQIYLGMRELADAFDTAIVGGDTNSWNEGLVLCVTLWGEPGPQGPILRRGAQPGDWLLATGAFGFSLLGHHLDFVPRIREALEMQTHARIHAMIDVSDGLAADVRHLCGESGCAAILSAMAIPIRAAARAQSDDKTALEHALADGEDFELVLAVSPDEGARLIQQQPIAGITLTKIGTCSAGTGLWLEENGQRRPLAAMGYEHRFGDVKE